jgi:hypothetical protein
MAASLAASRLTTAMDFVAASASVELGHFRYGLGAVDLHARN